MHSRASLLRRLLLGVLAVVATTWLVTVLISYREAREELDELLDAHLAQAAALLLAYADGATESAETGDRAALPAIHRHERGVAFQVWDRGTSLRLRSDNAPDALLSPQIEGFSNATIAGKEWRVFGTWDARRRHLVQVGEQHGDRREIVTAIVENLLLPLTIALPVLGVLLWFAIQRTLRPLHRLGRAVADRSPDNLAVVDLGDAPTEVVPLIKSLNRLLERVAASLDNERRFTADAAHELRTPLAALRAQAQVARGSRNDAERAHALDGVIAGCDRATHLVEQLLTLARLEPETMRKRYSSCDLATVARQTIGEIVSAALARNIDIELDVDAGTTGGTRGAGAGVEDRSRGTVEVAGDAQLLGVLLRNLLDNAIRYSPPHSTVSVRVTRDPAGPILIVADKGPGVATDALPGLGRRFHRLDAEHRDTGDASGTGLGLSIVRRIAEIHGASVEFAATTPAPGLSVQVRFLPLQIAIGRG